MRLLCALLLLLALSAPARALDRVDTALVLAVDVSSSVDAEEFDLQREGIAEALESEEVWRVVSGSAGSIAVTLMQWASAGEQKAVIPWRRVASRPDMLALAEEIRAMPRAFSGQTAIGAALEAAGALLDACPWFAARQVVDVSGDGESNEGPPTAPARDALAARGVQVNGLPIGGADDGIEAYYRDNVIGGPGAFLEPAEGFADFGRAMLAKLTLEIAARPSPRTFAAR